MDQHILPDILQPGLKVVFCGTAAGKASAEFGSYYAHPNNKFWTVLADTELTDRRLKPHEFEQLLRYGIGLTDLCKDAAGNDNQIPRPRPAIRAAFRAKVEQYAPTYLAFTSLEAGKRFYGKNVMLGPQADRIAGTTAYVLPSTSLMARWNWDATKSHWQEFAARVRSDIAHSD